VVVTEIGGIWMTAGLACAACGTGLRANAKFCDECGAPTAVPVDPAKYKQVTVLFADVVRSMDIAAALDVERLREIMTELVERSAAVVRRYGGTVEYNGDGVMALFGAPVALEITPFAPVVPRWPSRRKRSSWRPRCRPGTVWRCGCGWG
jgi:class 3 adenylate cyclase